MAFNYYESMSWLTGADFNLPLWLAYVIIVIQFYACFFLTLGIASRYFAGIILLCLLMTIPYHISGKVPLDWFGQRIGNGIQFHLLTFFTSVILTFKGSGKFSIDNYIRQAFM